MSDPKQLFDDTCLDVIPHPWPGVGVEPDRKVRAERVCHGDEDRDGWLTKACFHLLEVPGVDASSVA
jgi:hypothetical protein